MYICVYRYLINKWNPWNINLFQLVLLNQLLFLPGHFQIGIKYSTIETKETEFWHFKLKNTLKVLKLYNMNEINWYHFFSFSFFFNLILWVNIQLNVHFYIFCQITIYSNGSLADEIWWTFYKRTNRASGKHIKYGYDFFSIDIWIGQL